jgi:hypothetical protein
LYYTLLILVTDIEKVTEELIEKNIRMFYVYNEQADEMIDDIENKNKEMKNTLEESEKKKMKRSFEYDDRKNIDISAGMDRIKNSIKDETKKEEDVLEIDEIDEEIIYQDDSYDRDRRETGGVYNVSQSGGFDGTVDSNALEKYNYIEHVD